MQTKASELRRLTSPELENRLRDLKEELFNLRFQKAASQLENPKRISHVKKEFARIKTILYEREKGIR